MIDLYYFTLSQRFEQKRQLAFGIFLGFLTDLHKEAFELERMFNTINLLNISD